MERGYGPLKRAHLYLKHLFRSGNEHSVHSPSIFSLYCALKNAGSPDNFLLLERQRLLSDKTLFTIMDPGNDLREKKTSISELVKKSAKRPSQGMILHTIVKELKPNTCLELGTSLGLSAMFQHSAYPEARFTSVEGVSYLTELAQQNLKKIGLDTKVIHSTFQEFLSNEQLKSSAFDYIYLDGHHQYQPTIEYYHQLKSMVNRPGIIILDDIYWSEGMLKAWNEIRQDPDVSISVDLFHFGLLIYHEGVEKQHFSLRVRP